MYVVNLKDLGRKNISLAGGKGANLGELLKKKFLVPDGFVVSTIAYEKYLLSNGIYITEDERDDYEKIGQCIKNGKFPDEMFNEIKSAYNNMKNKKVAVRSSATAEDLSDASFAGQQESYLNVEGFEDVIKRIKDCFASCFTARSVRYRKYAGYGFSEVKAAVIIQEMVESDAAGLLFTSNILNGNRKQMIVNASYGLGESVVSGRINADEYILGHGGKVLKKYLGNKEKKSVYGEKEIVEVRVDSDKQKQWILDEFKLRELYYLGRKIEKMNMAPQDIEWALKDNKIYILQSRAITTFYSEDFNSICQQRKEKKLPIKVKNRLSFVLEHVPYAFYPLDFEVALLVSGEKEKVLSEAGIDLKESFSIDKKGIVDLSISGGGFFRSIFNLKRSIKYFLNIEDNEVKGKAILAECKKRLEEIKETDLDGKSLKDYGVMFKSLGEILEKIGYARFRYFIIPSIVLVIKLKPYLKNEVGLSEFSMLKDLPCFSSKINDELKKLAKELNEDCSNKEDKINEFLKMYGDKSDKSCYPFSALSWNENRKGFLEMLNLLINNSEEKDKVDNINYEDVLKIVKKNSGKKRNDIIRKVEYYRQCHIYREESRYMWEECHAVLRKILAKVAHILGVKIKDLWFLMFSELLSICENGNISNNDIDTISYRKFYRKEAEDKWANLHALVAGAKDTSNIVTGINGSDGVKRGRACVVVNDEDLLKLKDGDIMICNYMSSEWTPIFSKVSAIVSDTGSLLSHTAIVAREYGIPAVLGTGNGTRKIHDGDEIWVNASKGTVILC